MLHIYNTFSRKKEPFKSITEKQVKMYVCGMTVYDYCHIGHGRTVTSFDVIARYLRAKGYDLKFVRNITDVDDKIINRAKKENIAISDLTQAMIATMREDFRALGNLDPDEEPQACQYINQMIEMIQDLVEKDYAYAPGNGDVYYRVKKFSDYGRLSGQVLEEMEAGARIEVGEQKEDPLDFTLWKGVKADEPSWNSPWGAGRPGWHIECSAMSRCCLGLTFDIHGGGSDLTFPHHENEIAQSEAANVQKFANYWMHTGPVRIDNVKMSKSLGNFLTIRELLANHSGEVLRFFLISSHYRSPINYSETSLEEASRGLRRLYQALDGLELAGLVPDKNSEFEERFYKAMDDDFNTPVAISVLFEIAREMNRCREKDTAKAQALGAQLKELSSILGILHSDPQTFLQQGTGSSVDAEWIEHQIKLRARAKQDKNFALADEIRDNLLKQGIVLKDARDGTSWHRKT